MKRTLLTSFVFASISLGCSQSNEAKNQSNTQAQTPDIHSNKQHFVNHPELKAWVGHYSGVVPCATCVTSCDGCLGTGIDLKINADQTFVLEQSNNNDNSPAKIYAGQFKFLDNDQLKIQLQGVPTRNMIMLGDELTEIIDTKTQLPFDSYEEFQLAKKA
ncbi:copper resistance protein NlpE N-terminal domain-containing protein [Acinetobacter sp. TUM15071]|uniref:copper resistance protein NlpE N-terminal domain-containing protein n=1 Tax=Acinetobacter sp. TUM15071 TaxID=2609135 RepID=UPI00124C58C6|nr:copper resistance protein NlpE N-terminal domain-containing protein [Acinetobacter sp. TUM15071]